MTLLLRYWREGLVAVLVALLVAACHDRDNAIRAEQRAEDDAASLSVRLRAYDSATAALRERLADQGARIVHDTVRIARWRTDTVQAWRHDTVTVAGVPSVVVPQSEIAKADSGRQACFDLVDSCTAFKRTATERFRADSLAILDLRTHPRTVHTTSLGQKILYTALGALLTEAIQHVSPRR